MSIKSNFEPDLLKQPKPVRQAYFDGFMAEHSRIKDAVVQVMDIIHVPADSRVVHIVGPTGVGKSTLMVHLLKEIFEEEMPAMKKDPGLIPTAFITARTPPVGTYNWTDHFIRTMNALDEILVSKKIELTDPEPLPRDVPKPIRKQIGDNAAIQRAAESTLKNRKLTAFFIDNAHFLLKRLSEAEVKNQADNVFSVADQSDTLHVLIGTYDLLEMRNLNGQLARRSQTFHFSNYSIDDVNDRKFFSSAFKTLLSAVPLPEPPDLMDAEHVEFAYERSLGCIGILKNWLSRSLNAAMKRKDQKLNFKTFKQQALSIAECRQIAIEISKGKTKLKENEDALARLELRQYLGMDKVTNDELAHTTSEAFQEEPEETGSAVDSEPPSTKAVKSGKGTFRGSAESYPVGVDRVAS